MPNPVVNWNRGFKTWNKTEIYTGAGGTAIDVPNVNDQVIEWAANNKRVVYRVSAVDTNTLLSTLLITEEDDGTAQVIPENMLLAVLPGEYGDYKRLYVNNTTTPFSMAFDRRYRSYGSDVAFIKVFRGVDISNAGQVVSAMWDGNAVTSNNIPMANLTIPSGVNLGIRAPVAAWCLDDLPTGELVTAVEYNAAGIQLKISSLIIVRTEFVHTLNQLHNYIVDVELVSPFLSINDDKLLEIPINMVFQSLLLQGIVRYADGSTVTLPVDNTRFSLLGAENYVASVVNMPSPLTLIYRLQSNEYGVGISEPAPGSRHIARPYQIVTAEQQNQYSVKLFVVPTWVNTPAPKWTLEYYLYSLERDAFYYATPYVSISASSTPFDGSLLNIPQTLTVAVNLNQLSPSFDIFRHVQSFRLTLKNSGTNVNANSYVDVEYSNDHHYHAGNVAYAANDELYPGKRKLDLSMNLMDLSDWLQKMYHAAEPMRVSAVEAYPPTPTHFRLRIGSGWMREIAVADALEVVRDINVTVGQATTVRLEFFLRDNVTEYELSIASMTVKQQL